MVDLLFIAHEHACEVELAHLLAADLSTGQVPDPKALASRLTPRHMSLPADVAVIHPALEGFDVLLGASA
jgi:plasmid stability protein